MNKKKSVAQKQPQHAAKQIIHQSAEFSGPLPPPSLLADFNALVPGSAERIIAMAEKEQEYRHRSEAVELAASVEIAKDDQKMQRRGQIMAFLLAIIVLLSSFWMISLGHLKAGMFFSGTILLSLVGAFLAQNREKNTTNKN